VVVRAEGSGPVAEAVAVGVKLAEDLLAGGADRILAEFYDTSDE
jgi:hypothetical protein